METFIAKTNVGTFPYAIDNTGATDVSDALQTIFDTLQAQGVTMVTFELLPGVYCINKPLTLRFQSLAIEGAAHGGVDMHGMNQKSGTTLYFGKQCAPNCITLQVNGDGVSFPSGKTPWPYKSMRAAFRHLNFAGYNNTGVDTAGGYSRFTGDAPNFRELSWYPATGRYEDNERDGQRAIVIPQCASGEKAEMLSIEGCYFTDLYRGLDIAACDVSNIHHSWFGQLVDGITYHGAGQCIMMHDNCFADLETAVRLRGACMSTLHHNTFAYVSKCFVLEDAQEIGLSGNVMRNWTQCTGTAPYAMFLHAHACRNLNVQGTTLFQPLDSRPRTRTTDDAPNGKKFMHFSQCENVLLTGNLLDTVQTESVVCFEDCVNVLATGNMIHFGAQGRGCTIMGDSKNVSSNDMEV